MKARFLYLYGGAIGDALLGIHIGRLVAANVPGATLELVSTRHNPFVKELTEDLPFINYQELVKGSSWSWFALPRLMLQPYRSVVYEPVTSSLPLWWRLILWCARQARGSVQVRYQRESSVREIPEKATRVTYVCKSQNLFTDTPRALMRAWNITLAHEPKPHLPRAAAQPKNGPYFLFHFFAANYRRSIPVEQARAILISARAQFPKHMFVVTCGREEFSRAERMCEGIENVQLESDLHARDMRELLSGADLVVGTASGILFVAVHLGVHVIALSCLVDPCFLPDYSSTTTILAARSECRCDGESKGECAVNTPEGDVFRCLYFIPTEEVLEAMHVRMSTEPGRRAVSYMA